VAVNSSHTDFERIDRILNAVEHVWKLFPRWSFVQVIHEALGEDPATLTDEEVEVILRRFLHEKFSGSRDGT
jgi:hypothetical protein